MQLRAVWHGGDRPFEGEAALTLRALPADAVVHGARVHLVPRSAEPGRPFEERFVLAGSPSGTDLRAGDWAVTVRTLDGVIEVDLGARRTVTRVLGPGLEQAMLAVELGGIFVDVGRRGTVLAPGDVRFTLGADGVLPAITTRTLRLFPADRSGARVDAVCVRTAPSGVTVRLGDLAPFWSRPGELAVPATSLDVGPVLQAFLARAPVRDGIADVPLVLHSDALARLDVVVEVDHLRRASALPDGLPEATLTFGAAGVSQGVQPLQLRLPPGARVAAGDTTGSVVGSFAATRLAALDPAAAPGPDGTAAVPLAGPGMVATPLVLQESTAIVGVDLRLAATTADAVVDLLLREDDGGRPTGRDLMARPLPVPLSRAAQGGLTWVTATLPDPLRLVAGSTVWLVAQCQDGEAVWATAPAPAPAAPAPGAITALVSADGGFSWRDAGGTGGPVLAAAGARWQPATFRMPVALRVGTSGVDVPLTRFEPLGRLELDLGLPELGPAVTAAAAAAGPAPHPTGELLTDGALREWTSVGRDLGTPASLRTSGDATALAVSPDGTTAWIGTSAVVADVIVPAVEAVDLACGERTPPIPLPRVEPAAGATGVTGVTVLAVHPGGRRLYAGVGAVLAVVDPDAGTAAAVPLPRRVTGLATSPSGDLLYVAFDERAPGDVPALVAYATDALDDVALTGADPASARRATADLPDGLRPLALATPGTGPTATGTSSTSSGTGPTGTGPTASVAVLCDRADQAAGSAVLLFGAALDRVAEPVELHAGLPRALALSRSGSQVAVVSASAGDGDPSRLVLVDLASPGTPAGVDLDGEPVAVALDPDEPIAYAALQGGTVVPVDLGPSPVARAGVDAQVGTVAGLAVVGDGAAVALASRPSVDTGVHLIGSHDQAVTVIPVGVPVPQAWTVVSGRVRPWCAPGYGRATLLGALPRETPDQRSTVLAQVVPAPAGAPVELGFDALADRSPRGPACVAEVRWLGSGCSPGRVDTVPIREVDPADPAAAGRAGDPALRLLRHGARLTAPADAAQAEVRFVVPPGRIAAVGGVSLAAVAGALADPGLRRLADGTGGASSGPGWTVVSGGPPTVDLVDDAVRLSAGGRQELVLEQVTAVPAAADVTLTLRGRPAVGPDPVRVELRWTTAAAAPTGVPGEAVLVLPSGPGDLDLVAGRTRVPEGIAAAAVRVVVPAGGSLDVQEIGLDAVNAVPVPWRFTAQAPGQLAVREVTVRYDVRPVPPPGAPTSGRCPPSAPDGRRPDPDEPCCDCPGAGTPGDGTATARTVAVIPVLALGPGAAPEPSLPRVAGIGRRRLQRLASRGLGTADRVARLDAAQVRGVLPGVGRDVALRLVVAARDAAADAREDGDRDGDGDGDGVTIAG